MLLFYERETCSIQRCQRPNIEYLQKFFIFYALKSLQLMLRYDFHYVLIDHFIRNSVCVCVYWFIYNKGRTKGFECFFRSVYTRWKYNKPIFQLGISILKKGNQILKFKKQYRFYLFYVIYGTYRTYVQLVISGCTFYTICILSRSVDYDDFKLYWRKQSKDKA